MVLGLLEVRVLSVGMPSGYMPFAGMPSAEGGSVVESVQLEAVFANTAEVRARLCVAEMVMTVGVDVEQMQPALEIVQAKDHIIPLEFWACAFPVGWVTFEPAPTRQGT